MVTLPFPQLAFPTADNTVITADTINFTTDGADLINGGGQFIAEQKPKEYGGLVVTNSQYLRF